MKTIIKILKFVSVLLLLTEFANAQSTICTHTTCIPFVSTDLYQIDGRLQSLTITTTPSGTTNVQDNEADTLNARLLRINTFSRLTKLNTDSIKDFISGRQSGFTQAVTSSSVTGDGALVAGNKVINFLTSSDFSGTIDGITTGANVSVTFAANPGGKLPGISFTVAAGTIYIRRMQ